MTTILLMHEDLTIEEHELKDDDGTLRAAAYSHHTTDPTKILYVRRRFSLKVGPWFYRFEFWPHENLNTELYPGLTLDRIAMAALAQLAFEAGKYVVTFPSHSIEDMGEEI